MIDQFDACLAYFSRQVSGITPAELRIHRLFIGIQLIQQNLVISLIAGLIEQGPVSCAQRAILEQVLDHMCNRCVVFFFLDKRVKIRKALRIEQA